MARRPSAGYHLLGARAERYREVQPGRRSEKANKTLDAGINEVRKRLREDLVTGRVGLLISERAANLIQGFAGYKEEYVGTSAATVDAPIRRRHRRAV